MRTDHQCYVSSGSIRKDAHKFFNCISVSIFDIPVSQVNKFDTNHALPPGLHIMFGIFTKMLCCQLDLELASHTNDFDSSKFSKYSQALRRLPLLQGDLETVQHSQEVLQLVATYVVLVHGEENPLAVDPLKRSAAKKEISEGNHYTTCTIVFKLVQYRKRKWRNAQQL